MSLLMLAIHQSCQEWEGSARGSLKASPPDAPTAASDEAAVVILYCLEKVWTKAQAAALQISLREAEPSKATNVVAHVNEWAAIPSRGPSPGNNTPALYRFSANGPRK